MLSASSYEPKTDPLSKGSSKAVHWVPPAKKIWYGGVFYSFSVIEYSSMLGKVNCSHDLVTANKIK